MSASGKGHFDWARYITLSDDLLGRMKADEEDLARCGISRAYYGAFHLVVAYMKDQGIYRSVAGEGSHQTVIKDCASYKNSDNKTAGALWLKISENLKRLYDMRKKADYEVPYFRGMIPTTACMKAELIKAIRHAKVVQKNVNELKTVESSYLP